MTAPRRRCSFSLRTLFVVVTVFGCWLGWQLSIVRHRLALRKEMEAIGASFVSWHDYDRSPEEQTDPEAAEFRQSWSLRTRIAILGDEAIGAIYVSDSKFDDETLALILHVFPEARPWAIPDDGSGVTECATAGQVDRP